MKSVSNFLKELNEQDKIEAKFRRSMGECTLIDFRVLSSVSHTAKRMSDLSDMRGTARQGIGKVCQRLHQQGYVNIERDSRDGRARLVTITQEGKKLRNLCGRALTLALG